jgi:acyl-coenzyme A synthetase/AMP-(fatty) acid ligase
MFTSGTTGPPKMVVHDLAGLTGAIKPQTGADPVVWATFYDIRRYGGLQILLRGLVGGGSMAISGEDESIRDYMQRLGKIGVTHISGTPTHWRKALANHAPELFSPSYVRLSGEIADQAVLDQLKKSFPAAGVGHAFASTEAGVCFEVNDGFEGFPDSLIEQENAAVSMKVKDGSLRVKSSRTAKRYLGQVTSELADADGFVDTGDMVDLRDGRYYFAGRRDGVINVGGLKVHPEEIEAVINSHPGVRVSRASGRRNAFTGQIVVAEVVLDDDLATDRSKAVEAELKAGIVRLCESRLTAFKVPATIRFVPNLAMTAGGKLQRERT